MRTTIALVFGMLVVAAGCGGLPYSDPYQSPELSKKAECERAGGSWNPVSSVCRYPPFRP